MLRAFFASPFSPELTWIRNAVATACREENVQLRAVDEVVIPGESIVGRIHEEIDSADLAIAVISNLNPNVMYELGRVLQASKPVVILADETTFSSLPFDIRTFSAIRYDAEAKNQRDVATAVRGALSRIKDALTPAGRSAIASGKLASQVQSQTVTTVITTSVFAIDFEEIRKEAERRLGKAGCKTTDIESKDAGGFKGWHQKLDCPCGDEVLVVVDLNGDIVRTRIR